jgi:uncharacterized iron-regulated protein
MKYFFINLMVFLGFGFVNAQDQYQVFDREGTEVSLAQIISEADEKPLIFFGEIHDQSFAHQAELELLKGLHDKYKGRVVIGMEMFEADVQPILDEYFSGKINQKSFETESRIWSNYQSDYKPILEYAKENRIKLIGTNVPRRYANAVYHQGLSILDSLSDYAKQFFPKLPIQIDTTIQIYQEMLMMMPDHSNANMIYSQGLKDATMAHFILKNKNHDGIFLHLNGSYHSKNKQGILSFLKDYPLEKAITIQTVLKDKDQDIDFSSSDYTIIKI